ncbi:DNA polymerase III (plasmid) [Cupriavidus sp. USMAHM13]|nr:DNA polymerase III [Cupriavidus sp. USMAHM13]
MAPNRSGGNREIVATLEEIAKLLEAEDANPFRVRAYRRAARVIDGLSESVRDMLARGADLTALPGIGADLAAKIREIAETGASRMLASLRGEVPGGVADLLQVPGLGPKRARLLQHDLGISGLSELVQAAREHRVRQLHGFGARSEQRILEAVQAHVERNRRFDLRIAGETAGTLLRHLHRGAANGAYTVAGSYRRCRDTVGDLDVLATARIPAAVIRAFTSYPDIDQVLSAGTTRASVVLRNGMQVDLRVVRPDSHGAALIYLTGSKAHNLALRLLARSNGLKLNEYGLFRGTTRLAGETEEAVYGALGLTWIPPELREDRGEIAAARRGELPMLVKTADLQGDLHVHSSASDGAADLRTMAREAARYGLHYLAITDHSPRVAVAHGLDAGRLRAQADEIDRVNAEGGGAVLLKGVEVDIGEDGSLDLPDDVLGRLDLVVGAIHSHFDLPADRQTVRILRALDHPHFTILAHPWGRLIGRRDICHFDLERVLRALAQRGSFIEANAQPNRLDLWDIGCQQAKAAGVLVSIASDAHGPADFGNLPLGVGQARRGWLGPSDVLNARPLAEVRTLLRRTM